MTHFAEINENNIVVRIIVVNDEHEADGEAWCSALFGGRWKQTSYNGRIRKNYAGIGFLYDEALDAFIPPKPHDSWMLDEYDCRWVSPVEKPEGEYYVWSEDDLRWVNIFPLYKYGLDADYDLIEDAVQRYGLSNFKTVTVFSSDDFKLMLQQVNNLIFFHATINNYNRTIHDVYGTEVDKLQRDLGTDIYSYSSYPIEENQAEVDKLTRFSEMFGGEALEDYASGNGMTYRILIRAKDKIA